MSRKKKKQDRRQIFHDLKAGAIEPIYYIHGPDVFMLDSAVEAVIKAAAPDGLNDFNHERFYGKEATGDKLNSAVEQLPFMVDRRLVILRDAQDMHIKEWEALVGYFENPSPTTVLIIHALTVEKKLDGRLTPIKKMRKAAAEYELNAYWENELDDFVRRQAQRRKLELNNEGIAYIVQAVGTDLAALDSAIVKLDLYIGNSKERRNVDPADVREVIAQTRVHSVFALTDALGSRDFQATFHVLETMMYAGENAIRILAMVARHFRILAKFKDPTLRSMDRYAAAKAVGVVPFFFPNYKRDADRFSVAEIRQIQKRVLETDFALKSSKLADKTILESLLWDICFREAKGARK